MAEQIFSNFASMLTFWKTYCEQNMHKFDHTDTGHNFTSALGRIERSSKSLRPIVPTKEEAHNFIQLTQQYDFYTPHYFMRQIYVAMFGWGLFSMEQLEAIHDAVPSNVTIVDYGAGYGLMSSLLQILFGYTVRSVDNFSDYISGKNIHSFTEVQKIDDSYVVNPNHALLVSWGRYHVDKVVDEWRARGGTYLIIIGEYGGGCTFPIDHVKDVEPIRQIDLPNFYGINTCMNIYQF
jgi:hypothetical protein